jgi:hypothetical protein
MTIRYRALACYAGYVHYAHFLDIGVHRIRVEMVTRAETGWRDWKQA